MTHQTNANGAIALTPQFPQRVSVKIIGTGGVGMIVAQFAAHWLAIQSLRFTESDFRVVLIDGDAFEPGNTRMAFSRLGNKAEVACDDLHDRLGQRIGRLMIEAVAEYVTPGNTERLVCDDDHVMLCVDSHASRKLVSDHFAKSIESGVLISCGNDGVGKDGGGFERRGSFGNCQVHLRRDGQDVTPSLTRFHPEIADPADKLPTDLSCTDLVVSVPQLLFANYWAAGCALASLFLSFCPDMPTHSELVFDFAEGIVRPVDLPAPVSQGQPQHTGTG